MKPVFNYINKTNGDFFLFCLHLNSFGEFIYMYASKYIAVILFMSTAGKHIYAELA